MNKLILLLPALFTFLTSCSQTLVSNREKIEKAKVELADPMKNFSSCIVKSNVKVCEDELIKSADNEYKKYIVAGVLYEIDPEQSLKLHKEAYIANTTEQNFVLEYAIELHRNKQYNEASKLYEIYSEKVPTDYRVHIWLSDCYLNTGETDKSIENWNESNHPENHVGIDNALFTIYGKTTQIKKRSDLKADIEQGKFSSFFPLIFLDKNWESDWWNTNTQEYFLNEDLKLAEIKLGNTNPDFKTLKAYLEIKRLEEQNKTEEIKKILTDNKIILENYPIPPFGEISSDLLRICFMNKILNESDFYSKRGDELLELAKKTKDKDLLNIYAYLQGTVNGKVDSQIDKMGWKEFKDERFAQSYFSIKTDIKYDDKELNEALLDFPNSSYLFWLKAKCAKMENKPVRADLIEAIKREFKTLATDPSKFSYRLNSFMRTLKIEKV